MVFATGGLKESRFKKSANIKSLNLTKEGGHLKGSKDAPLLFVPVKLNVCFGEAPLAF